MTDPTRTLTAADGPPTVSAADAGTTAADRTPDEGFPPSTPPGYELGEEVGRGGMGVVFRARDQELNREVAVKILLPKYPPHSATARRFVDEAHITSQLQHPGVPPMYRVGHLADGRPFLAMKLIKGQTLDALLRGRVRGRPEFGRWLGVFEGICQAVGYAHEHHVLHRDLKPANVMVGAFGEVQVMDWGLAKLLAPGTRTAGDGADPDVTAAPDPTEIVSPRDADLLTQYGSMLGTPAFMAPEQAIGEVDQIDRRTDVFGLGAILCALLTGQPPYVGDSAESTRRLAARAKLGDCFARLDGCGAEPDLAALCKRCLSAEPAGRPADAGEVARLVHDLRAAADERARRAEIDRERAEVRASELRKRRRVLAWAGGVVAGVLLAGVVGTTAGLIEARKHEADATKQAGLARDEAGAKEAARADEERQRGLAELRQREAEAAAAAAKAAKEREGVQRAKAERARDRSADVLDAMTSDLTGESLTRQGDLNDQQRRFLAQALAYYKEFAAETADDPATQPRVAAAALRVARIEAQLGRVNEAADAYRTAADRYQRLAADQPDKPEYRAARAVAHAGLGWALEVINRRADAEKQFRTALEVAERLAADFPAAPEHRTTVAATANSLGRLLINLGPTRWPEAETLLNTAVATAERLAAESSKTAAYRVELGNGLNNLGILATYRNQPAGAEKWWLAALKVRAKLTTDFPTNPWHQSEQADTHNNLGGLYAQADRLADAEAHLRAAFRLREQLAADFPAVALFRSRLAYSCKNLAEWAVERGEGAAAEPLFRKAFDQFDRLATAFPAVSEYTVSFARTGGQYGRLLRQIGRPAEAVAVFDRALARLSAPAGRASAAELRANVRADRAAALADVGRAAEAVAEVADLTRSPNWPAGRWYDFACVCSVASAKIAGKQDEYAGRAMGLLRQAVNAGWKDAAHVKADKDLDPLREREDFRKLLADLERKFPPTREVLPAPRRE